MSPAPPLRLPGADDPSGMGSDSGSAGAVVVAARAGPSGSAERQRHEGERGREPADRRGHR